MMRLNPFVPPRPRVSVVRLTGAIGVGARGLDDASMAQSIERAFRAKPKAVALQISSPGGSPVQSSLIAARIRRLADEKNVPVFAFVEDVAASGGYWLATAADEIVVDPASIVGSIGVISAGFGAQRLISRYGIERRVHTAGESKSFLDPFSPEDPQDVERLEAMLDELHEVFIGQVRARRGDKLSADPEIFTGRVWIGANAVGKGLADATGHLVPVMKQRFGDKATFRRFGPRRPLFQRLGAQMAGGVMAEVEERALSARYGL